MRVTFFLPGPLARPWPALLARLGTGGLVLGLVACATPSAPPAGLTEAASAALPTQWAEAPPAARTAPDDAALATWWTLLGDADLQRLITQALAHNTDVRIAQATLRQAQAARAVVEAGGQPQLMANASASRNRSQGSTSGLYQLGLSASWEPDWRGSQAAWVNAAQASEQAAQADLATTRMSLAAEVAIAYVQWRDAQARTQLTQHSRQSLADTLALTQWRTQAGLDSSLALEQARLSLAQTEASLPPLATEVATQAHQLAWLTGQTVAQLQLPSAGALPSVAAALAQLEPGVPADLLRRRPDLRAAEASLRTQWATLEGTRREGWPGLSLSGSLGWQALSLASLGSGSSVAALAATVSSPLWDGGLRRAQVAQQDALLTRQQLAYEAAVRSALKDVEDALVTLRQLHTRLAGLAQATQAAHGVLLLTQQQRSAGLLSLADELAAQRTWLAAQLSEQSARADQALALVRLYKALGGGWTPDTQAPAAQDRPA